MGREGRERLGRSSLTSRVCEERGNLATQREKKPTERKSEGQSRNRRREQM